MVALSMDAFVASFAYGAQRIKIPFFVRRDYQRDLHGNAGGFPSGRGVAAPIFAAGADQGGYALRSFFLFGCCKAVVTARSKL